VLFITLTGMVARIAERLLPAARRRYGHRAPAAPGPVGARDAVAGHQCAAREALHQADVVETMLRGILPVIRNNDLALAEQLRRMDDTVDELYSADQVSTSHRSPASRCRSARAGAGRTSCPSRSTWKQIGDIIERRAADVEDKKIRKNRSFSDAGMSEIVTLHERLMANLRLGMSVFLDGHVRDAKKLLEEKARFRDMEHEFAEATSRGCATTRRRASRRARSTST